MTIVDGLILLLKITINGRGDQMQVKKKKPEPIAVISGDIHYNLQNLEVADIATRMAIVTANDLNIPFIANGDITDNKAILRAECVNAMIETFKTTKLMALVNIGNHDKIHNKDTNHALNFLRPYATLIDFPQYVDTLGLYIIPYFDAVDELRGLLKTIPKGSTLIMHQGLISSNAGHYMQDKAALDPSDLINFRTILSHYHARQDIKCGNNIASFIGSPYTTSFGESADLPKGYQILYENGSLEFVPTNLRRHRILELNTRFTQAVEIGTNDILWVKVTGPTDELAKIQKAQLAKDVGIKQDFRLDLIPTDTKPVGKIDNTASQAEILDSVIDNLQNTEDARKTRLKQLWRKFT